jgi:hypothetical protein
MIPSGIDIFQIDIERISVFGILVGPGVLRPEVGLPARSTVRNHSTSIRI